MESFFALLRRNVLDRRRWISRDDLSIKIVTWIEHDYHHRRRQPGLGKPTPKDLETIHNSALSTLPIDSRELRSAIRTREFNRGQAFK